MKTLPRLILSIAVLATLGGLAIAESPAVKSSDRAAVNKATPTPGHKPLATTIDKSTRGNTHEITGTVSQVDQKTKTFTLKTNGRENKFLFSGNGMPPKVGAVITVAYTGRLAGASPVAPPVAAATYTVSKSNSY